MKGALTNMSNTTPQHVDFRWPNSPRTHDSSTDAAEPAPGGRSVRAKLKSIGDVSHELAKLYREARSGRLDVADASRLANMLYILSRILETSELEKRVEALEARTGH